MLLHQCRPSRALLRSGAFTVLFMTAFELFQFHEMRSDQTNNDAVDADLNIPVNGPDNQRLVGVDPVATQSGRKQHSDIGNQHIVSNNVDVIKYGDKENADKIAVDVDVVVAGEDRRVTAETLDRYGQGSRSQTQKVEDDPNQRLPDDFWNGRSDDDIVIDTQRPIVNPHPFRRTIESRSRCGDQQGADVFLVCYVHTAVDHFKRRARIRETWGRQENYNNTKIRVVFFTGRTDKAGWLQGALEYEAEMYDDIVQEDFLDTYRYTWLPGCLAAWLLA